MTGQNREENAWAEIRRAEQALVEAEALVKLGLGNGAASRAYYAGFHAASALLVRLGHQARTHRGVQSLLERHLVAPGFLGQSQLTLLARLEERRAVADYQAGEEISAEQARGLVADAQAFVSIARSLLDTLPR